jgi:hypothetical protein
MPSHQVITLGPSHFDRGHMGSKFALRSAKSSDPGELPEQIWPVQPRKKMMSTGTRCLSTIDSAPRFFVK